jgi:ATP synthase protein I
MGDRPILDRRRRRQYVARGLPGQVDFAAISSDGFFKSAVALRSLSGEARNIDRAARCGERASMAERDGGEDEERLLRARLERLSGALEKQRKGSAPRPDEAKDGGSSGKFGSAMGLGLRAASEFAATIVVGGLIGWQIDGWLGTKPAFLIIFFMLGVGAGVWNVIRVTSPLSRDEKAGRGQQAPPAVDEDED